MTSDGSGPLGSGNLGQGGTYEHTFQRAGTGDLEQLFFVNGAASAVVAGALALSRNPVPALAGAGIAAGSLGAFALSRTGSGVVGFRGTGLDPSPEVPLTLVVEAAALLVIALVMFRHAGWIRSVSGAAGGQSSASMAPRSSS